jgi:hypothetical protein
MDDSTTALHATLRAPLFYGKKRASALTILLISRHFFLRRPIGILFV